MSAFKDRLNDLRDHFSASLIKWPPVRPASADCHEEFEHRAWPKFSAEMRSKLDELDDLYRRESES